MSDNQCSNCGGFCKSSRLVAERQVCERVNDVLSEQLEKQWIADLRKELMHSKMTHNFTFSRDEVVELLDAKPQHSWASTKGVME